MRFTYKHVLLSPHMLMNSRIESELTPLPEAFDPEDLDVDKDRIVNSPWVYRRVPVRYVVLCNGLMLPLNHKRLTLITCSFVKLGFLLRKCDGPISR